MSVATYWRTVTRWVRDARISLSLFTFSVVVLVFAIFSVALSIENIIGEYSSIASTHAVLGALATTRNSVESRVNSLRSYLITGNKDLLVDYRSAGSELAANLANLRALVSGDSALAQRTETLQDAITEQNASSERILDAYQRGQTASVRQLLNDDDTKLRRADHVRAAITAFDAKEHTSLSASMSQTDTTLRFAILAGTLGLSVYFIVQCIVFARMDKESERRRGADSSLVAANIELESSLELLRQRDLVTQAVSQFSEILQNCRSVNEAITITLHQVVHFLPTISTGIGLFNEARDTVVMHRSKIGADGCQEFHVTNLTPQECWGLRRGRVHLYTRGEIDPRCDHIPEDSNRSMCIPILGQGETLGIMSLYSQPAGDASVQNWDVAMRIGERLAPALANLRLQETLRIQSVRDQLTGLFNRRYLDESLAKELARARRHDTPVSVIMLDVDNFKQFNDVHGHDGGDLVLKAFGQLLAFSVRFEDIACRYGGEEFMLVLPGADHELALRRANEIRLAIERLPFSMRDGAAQHCTTSIGVATYPEHGRSVEDIRTAADAALYLAKSSGRNRVVGAISPISARVAAAHREPAIVDEIESVEGAAVLRS